MNGPLQFIKVKNLRLWPKRLLSVPVFSRWRNLLHRHRLPRQFLLWFQTLTNIGRTLLRIPLAQLGCALLRLHLQFFLHTLYTALTTVLGVLRFQMVVQKNNELSSVGTLIFCAIASPLLGTRKVSKFCHELHLMEYSRSHRPHQKVSCSRFLSMCCRPGCSLPPESQNCWFHAQYCMSFYLTEQPCFFLLA